MNQFLSSARNAKRRVARTLVIGAMVSAATALLGPVPVAWAAPSPPGGPAAPPTPGAAYARGQGALDRLGSRLPDVARAHFMSAAGLRSTLLADPTLALDAVGGLAYFDVAAPGGTATAATVASTAAAAPDTSGPQFQLASLPGAEKTIYLDFDGNVTEGTSWNTAYGVTSIVSPPYDTDANPSAFSASELANIANAWKVVAEDYAPWNVNVTTIDPGVEALRKTSSSDTQYGVRVVVTADTFANCGCGGHAYVGSFDSSTDIPAFVYNTSARGVSEAISHEVGHTLNLAHDGLTNGTTYYTGHGTGETSWAPIMGASYYSNTTQWSRQEYTGANNTGAAANYGNGDDDVAVIGSMTNGNGFGLRPDDHGDTAATATAIPGTDATVSGTIGTQTDVDTFAVTGQGGTVSLTASPLAAPAADLDLAMTIRDSGGTVVATVDNPTGHAVSYSAVLPAGSYTVSLDGVGAGDPTTTPPTGYTDYASLGQYTLAVRIQVVTPPDTTPPAAPTGLTATASGSAVALAWAANAEADLGGYQVQRAATVGGPFTTILTTAAGTTTAVDPSPTASLNVYRVLASDVTGNLSVPSAIASIDLTPPPPPPFSVATGETVVAGTVSGTYAATQVRDGVSESITEVYAGGKPSTRYDSLEHRWSIPASTGLQTLSVVAGSVDAGDADAGFTLAWSTDGTTWRPLATFSGSLDATYPLGQPSGTVYVRVVDTDSTVGQTRFDTVSVDLLRIDGGPVVTPTSVAVSDFTVGTAAGPKSRSYGTVSVTVVDNLGTPVVGASVKVAFSGSFTDAPTLLTNAAGVATYRTTTAVSRPAFQVCITGVTAGLLTYAGGQVCKAG